MKKVTFISLILIVGFILPCVAQQDTQSTIEEAAKKERKLVWYTSMHREHAWRILYEFMDLYPFIEAELYRAGSFIVYDKYLKELKKGDVKVDVIHSADIGTYLELEESDHLLYYDSPQYSYFPEEYKSHGYWASMRTVSVCISYNASKISQDEAPNTWKDIQTRGNKWKGRIGVGNVTGGAGTMYAQYYFLRELYDVDFWESLTTLDPILKNGSFTLMSLLIDEEIDITLTSLGYQVYNASIKEGKPIRGIWPEDGVPMQPCPIAIVKEAPHPNAAKLFIDFALSLEGQTLCQAIVGCYSVREGVPALPSKIPFSEIKQPFKVDWKESIEKRDAYNKEFGKIFEDFIGEDNE